MSETAPAWKSIAALISSVVAATSYVAYDGSLVLDSKISMIVERAEQIDDDIQSLNVWLREIEQRLSRLEGKSE